MNAKAYCTTAVWWGSRSPNECYLLHAGVVNGSQDSKAYSHAPNTIAAVNPKTNPGAPVPRVQTGVHSGAMSTRVSWGASWTSTAGIGSTETSAVDRLPFTRSLGSLGGGRRGKRLNPSRSSTGCKTIGSSTERLGLANCSARAGLVDCGRGE